MFDVSRPFKLIKRKKLYISVVALFLLLIITSFFLTFAKKFSLRILSCSARFSSSTLVYFRSKKGLVRENRFLHKRVGDLSLKVGQLKGLKRENERLRELLSFRRKIGFDTISAEVIARNPNDWVGSFIIDKGSADGVRNNSAVCSSDGLLGKVAEADERSSVVMMITHPSFRAGGVIKNTRLNGVVAGAGKGRVKMLYIPAEAMVKEGAVVTTSGMSRTFPKGIEIGRIVSVEKSNTGLYKYAVIKPSADLFSQEEVLCVK